MRFQDIREALAERLRDVDGVRPYAYPLDTVPAGQGDVVVVTAGENWVDYHEAFQKGLAIANYRLNPYIQMVDPRSALNRLDELASSGTGAARSLIDALMDGDKTLGGVCSNIVVDTAGGIRAEQIGEARYLTCDIDLRVLVGRT